LPVETESFGRISSLIFLQLSSLEMSNRSFSTATNTMSRAQWWPRRPHTCKHSSTRSWTRPALPITGRRLTQARSVARLDRSVKCSFVWSSLDCALH